MMRLLRFAFVEVDSAHVMLALSDEQRQAAALEGTPLPLIDPPSGNAFILMAVEMADDPLGGLVASIPGISAYGSGDTSEEALLALTVSLGQALSSR